MVAETREGAPSYFPYPNTVSQNFGTIAGGVNNQVDALSGSIGGGDGNHILAGSDGSVVAGGAGNTIQGSASVSAIGGGADNLIAAGAVQSVVAGGWGNSISGWESTISGGGMNTIGTGGQGSVIGGGHANTILPGSSFCTIPGGAFNTAGGASSFAAGYHAKTIYGGSFVWADYQESEFAAGGPNQFLIRAAGGVGIGTNNPAAGTALHVNGTARVNILQIMGGADLAEPFEMSSDDIPKGSVVIIDEKNPGHLKLSEQAYDHRVAGIISGANGIQPGLTLSQQGVAENGQHVALSGRVYCLADASNGPIHPGDLLTTSERAGHAMKVTDHAQAQGAILARR